MGRNGAGIDRVELAQGSQQEKGKNRQGKAERNASHRGGQQFAGKTRRGDFNATFETDCRHQIDGHCFGKGFRDGKIGSDTSGKKTKYEEQNHR